MALLLLEQSPGIVTLMRRVWDGAVPCRFMGPGVTMWSSGCCRISSAMAAPCTYSQAGEWPWGWVGGHLGVLWPAGQWGLAGATATGCVPRDDDGGKS